MESVEKLRVLLPHWLEHNKGHMAEAAKWAQALRDEGQEALAAQIEEAVAAMGQAGVLLGQALDQAGGPAADGHHHHHHHH